MWGNWHFQQYHLLVNEHGDINPFFKFILRERKKERERQYTHAGMSRGGAERERGRESQTDSAPSVQSPMWALNSRTVRS